MMSYTIPSTHSISLPKSGPYAVVLHAQMDYMEKLWAEQEKNNVTHNADGLPTPGPVHRRSSVMQT